MKSICEKCSVARGFRKIKCSHCGEEELSYSNCADLCSDCAEKRSKCRICGESTKSFDELMVNYEENIDVHVSDIVRWIKDNFESTGANGVVLGMSGGIDCSVVARLFDLADIPVHLVMMPYGNSMELSGDRGHAELLIDKFKLNSRSIDITQSVDGLIASANEIADNRTKIRTFELSKEAIINVKPRVRMTILYSIAQSLGCIVAGTGNLSERTMGYFTKWGDGACDINPIGELTKAQVRIIAKKIGIPDEIINKPPSANLFEGQTDESEMGVTYYELDKYILTKEASEEVKQKIEKAKSLALHKIQPIPMPHYL